MAYEVIKRVGRRAYRYSVESYRDAESKKVRARWTYLGAVRPFDAEAQTAPRRTAGETRERLLDAFERLLEKHPYATVTAGSVALEAAVAHGTFYRYFKAKPALLRGAVERIREEVDRLTPSFDAPFGSRAAECERVRNWIRALLQRPASRPGLLRAYYDALEVDSELRTLRLERRRERVSALRRYLERLHAEGTIALDDPEPLAQALVLFIDAVVRRQVVETAMPDDATIAGVLAVFDRAIFA